MKRKFHGVCRLAMREEGHMWNAYFAQMHTMDNALLIGSIAMKLVEDSDALKTAFLAVMRDAVSVMLKEITGADEIEWPEPMGHKAPEHERGGNT